MRGAALKLGQMLSIQDESVIPPQISRALERVRQGADIMPRKQLEKVLTGEQGPGWKSRLAEFDDLPMAAASIGQVRTFGRLLFCSDFLLIGLGKRRDIVALEACSCGCLWLSGS